MKAPSGSSSTAPSSPGPAWPCPISSTSSGSRSYAAPPRNPVWPQHVGRRDQHNHQEGRAQRVLGFRQCVLWQLRPVQCAGCAQHPTRRGQGRRPFLRFIPYERAPLRSPPGARPAISIACPCAGRSYAEPSDAISLRLIADYSQSDENCCVAYIAANGTLAGTGAYTAVGLPG